jgi:hypothetical protein
LCSTTQNEALVSILWQNITVQLWRNVISESTYILYPRSEGFRCKYIPWHKLQGIVYCQWRHCCFRNITFVYYRNRLVSILWQNITVQLWRNVINWVFISLSHMCLFIVYYIQFIYKIRFLQFVLCLCQHYSLEILNEVENVVSALKGSISEICSERQNTLILRPVYLRAHTSYTLVVKDLDVNTSNITVRRSF